MFLRVEGPDSKPDKADGRPDTGEDASVEVRLLRVICVGPQIHHAKRWEIEQRQQTAVIYVNKWDAQSLAKS